MGSKRCMRAGGLGLLLLLLAAWLLPGCAFLTGGGGDRKPMVVAYVAGYREFDLTTIQARKITHINYAFANVIDGRVSFGKSIDGTAMKKGDIAKLVALKRLNPDLKVLVSVGGWTWSKDFSDVALTANRRERFAASAAEFVREYGLDGIDIDWEYPNQPGAGNTHRPEDRRNFTLLLRDVRRALDRLAARTPGVSRYLLAIATGADRVYVDNVELHRLHPYLDFINIMAYDFYHGLHRQTGHHSNFRPSATPARDMNSVVAAVERHIEAGVPPHKLNLGLPFYGRKWTGVASPIRHGLFQKARSVGQIIYYRKIVPLLADPAWQQHWDPVAQAPYLWNPGQATFISYETPRSLAIKLQWVKQKGLGGVMFWEYTDDHEGVLLDAVHRGLKGNE